MILMRTCETMSIWIALVFRMCFSLVLVFSDDVQHDQIYEDEKFCVGLMFSIGA